MTRQMARELAGESAAGVKREASASEPFSESIVEHESDGEYRQIGGLRSGRSRRSSAGSHAYRTRLRSRHAPDDDVRQKSDEGQRSRMRRSKSAPGRRGRNRRSNRTHGTRSSARRNVYAEYDDDDDDDDDESSEESDSSSSSDSELGSLRPSLAQRRTRRPIKGVSRLADGSTYNYHYFNIYLWLMSEVSRMMSQPRPKASSSRGGSTFRRVEGGYLSSSSSSDSDEYERQARAAEANLMPINDGQRALRADLTPVALDSTIDWSQVGGLDVHIRSLKEMVTFPLMYPELYKRFNVSPPKGVLFYGTTYFYSFYSIDIH